MAKRHRRLQVCMGGKKMRTTEHAHHIITRKRQEAWNKKPSQVASLLLLELAGAFDNVTNVPYPR